MGCYSKLTSTIVRKLRTNPIRMDKDENKSEQKQ